MNPERIYQDLSQRFDELFKPRERLNVWQWAEANIIIRRGTSPRPGPYRTDWCPYVRAPQEDFTNHDVQDIVLNWAARTTKTQTILNCFCYGIAVDPMEEMMVMPSRDMARMLSEKRLQPMINDCAALAAQKLADPDKFRFLEMQFKEASIALMGANSPANLKSRGVTVLGLDEIDTWKKATKRETGALQQVLERTKDRWNRKHLITSTPTVEDGQIWIEFLAGDQRYYFVPCPHCSEYQTLKLKQLKWDPEAKTDTGEWDPEKVKVSTYYECEKCKGHIEDSHKLEMLRKGEWRATAKSKIPRRRSYHLSALYPEWVPFHEVANMFLISKSSAEELQRFLNSWMAVPFQSHGDGREQEEAVEAKKTDIQIEGVPEDHKVLISCDVQIHHLYFVARAWNKDKASIRLDYGILPGTEELLLVHKKWNAAAGFIDCAFRPQMVLEFCAKNPQWFPTLGSPILSTPMRWSQIPVDGGLMKGHKVNSLRYRADDWKEILTEKIQGKGPKWEIQGEVGDVYKKQMAGERRVEKRGPRGMKIVTYVRVGPNHYWDCEVIQTVGFEGIRPILFDIPQVDDKPPGMSQQSASELEEIRRPIRHDEDIWAGTKGLSY